MNIQLIKQPYRAVLGTSIVWPFEVIVNGVKVGTAYQLRNRMYQFGDTGSQTFARKRFFELLAQGHFQG